MRKRLSILTKVEKILVAFLSLVVLITATQITHAFYIEHSDITPVEGGIYLEGAVGKVGLINPLYVQYGTITHDLTQLIFSGLTKYDPASREISAADTPDRNSQRPGTRPRVQPSSWKSRGRDAMDAIKARVPYRMRDGRSESGPIRAGARFLPPIAPVRLDTPLVRR